MKLYVIRHGQSVTNQTGCYTGWSQIPLTEKGVREAESIRPLLAGVPFDKVYASDLIRAQQTARAALPGMDFEETALLREVGLGALEGTSIAALSAQDKETGLRDGYADWGGESREDFRARIRSFMALAEKEDCEYMAAFSHRGWLMGMLAEVLEIPLPKNTVCCDNCAVAVFEYRNGQWRLYSWINRETV